LALSKIKLTLPGIATMLNEEGIPTSQWLRSGRKAYWYKSAIKEMLKNKRYVGQTTWGRTQQRRDPETGKLVKHYLPESEWEKKEITELRIVSDVLFESVQQQFERATRGLEVKRLGGMTRTEASRKYLFSGV
jgi:hypothetical protein